MAKLITIAGDVSEPTPANGHHFLIDELYKLIGCEMVEVVPLPDGRKMVLDEEGKLHDRPLNEFATTLAREFIAGDDYIVGNVILMTNEEIEAVE